MNGNNKKKDHENYKKRDFALITVMFLVKGKQTNKRTRKIAYSLENTNFGYSLVKRAFHIVLWLPERKKKKTPAYCKVVSEILRMKEPGINIYIKATNAAKDKAF